MRFILGRDRDGQLVSPERAPFRHHCSITGNPGTGKSMICLTLIKQAILRPDSDVRLITYIDMKGEGDPVARNWLAQNVPKRGEFVYFTTNDQEESATYNPLAHIMTRCKTPSSRNDLLCSRLGISKASKESFFPHLNMALGLEAFKKVEREGIALTSFDQLHEILEGIRDAGGDRYKHGTDILNRVKALAACPRLADRPGKKAIVVPQLFERPTILCVSLPVLEGTNMPEYVAKCLLSDLVLSANGRAAYLFCDEAHRLLNTRETILVAEQGRGFGIGIILAAQSAEQYQTEDGKPLGWLVDKLARVKLQFSPNTVEDLKKYMVLSGLKDVQRTSRTVSSRPGADGLVPAVTESVTTFDDTETRLGLNDLLDHTQRPMSFILQIDQDADYGRPTLVNGAWPLTKAEYEALRIKPWPAPQEPEAPRPQLPVPKEAAPPKQRKEKSEALKACEEAATTPPRKSSRRKKKR